MVSTGLALHSRMKGETGVDTEFLCSTKSWSCVFFLFPKKLNIGASFAKFLELLGSQKTHTKYGNFW